MERPGLVLDTSNDVERVPGRYQTSEEWMEIVDRAVRAGRGSILAHTVPWRGGAWGRARGCAWAWQPGAPVRCRGRISAV